MPDDFESLDRATKYRSPDSIEMMRSRFEKLVAEDPGAANQFKRWRGGAVEAADVSDSAYPAGKIAEKACEALQELRGGKPFFLGAGFAVTHLPWLSPQKYWNLIPEQSIHLPDNMQLIEGIPDRYRLLGNEAYQYFEQNYHEAGATLGWTPDKADAERMTRGYYAAISYLDAQIGRILKCLEEEGLRDETIVVFTTDHGFAVGEHRHWGKHCLHEPDLQVPLIIRAPGYAPGRTRALTEHVDLFPTVCDLLGVEAPDFVEGASLKPLIDDPRRSWKQAVFSQARKSENEMGYTLRSDQYRYSRWVTGDGEVAQEELYDYRRDPGSMRSVHAESDYSEVLSEMRELYEGGWRSVRDALTGT
jgi:arylsulfatase A-like enzyme